MDERSSVCWMNKRSNSKTTKHRYHRQPPRSPLLHCCLSLSRPFVLPFFPLAITLLSLGSFSSSPSSSSSSTSTSTSASSFSRSSSSPSSSFPSFDSFHAREMLGTTSHSRAKGLAPFFAKTKAKTGVRRGGQRRPAATIVGRTTKRKKRGRRWRRRSEEERMPQGDSCRGLFQALRAIAM